MLQTLILIGVTKKLAGKNNVLVAICEIPTYNSWILTTADDSPRIKLQLEHARICALVGKWYTKGVRVVVVVRTVMVVVRCAICRCTLLWLLSRTCCC